MLRKVRIQYFKGLTDVTLDECGPINALVGKNNSGKSSVLHAIDMAGLALSARNWSTFQPKLEIKDMFSDAGPFTVDLDYDNGLSISVSSQAGGESPTFDQGVTDDHRFGSLLIMPDPEMGLLRRRHLTPRDIMSYVQSRQFGNVSGLDILFALRHYADRREQGFQPEDYRRVVADVREFFPDIEELESDRTDQDIATLTYEEYGRVIDILYAGTGLKHFLDVVIKVTLSQASVVLIDEPEVGLHPDLQRRFVDFMKQWAGEKGLQFFLATHSPVFLGHPDVIVFTITNRRGSRDVTPVDRASLHTVWADMGIRPSDLLQNDIVVMVEGQKDIIVLDYIINNLYRRDFEGVSVGVIQYGGSSADGIVGGDIDVGNITSAQGFVLWIRDRDAKPADQPSSQATRFANAIRGASQECHILDQREIEWYLPESLYVDAQQGNRSREAKIRAVLGGNQGKKFVDAAKGCTIPRGKTLRQLIQQHVSRDNLHPELKQLVEERLIRWRNQIVGVD